MLFQYNYFFRGLDFRPEYRKVADIISLFASCPTLLLTATATEKIQEDLYSLLALDNDTKVVAVLPDRYVPNNLLRLLSFKRVLFKCVILTFLLTPVSLALSLSLDLRLNVEFCSLYVILFHLC